MADFGIFIKNADIQARAGTGANATAKAVAATDIYVLDVEAYINSYCMYNFSDAVTAGLNADVEGILTDVGACLCAMYVIQWDMDGYGSLARAQTMLDVLRDKATKGLEILRLKATQDFIINA